MGRYIGSTQRLLKVRIDAHKGVSHRSQDDLSTKEHSAIRNHSISCKNNIQYKHFSIIYSGKNSNSLLTAESLLIKSLVPTLNADKTSCPLYIA